MLRRIVDLSAGVAGEGRKAALGADRDARRLRPARSRRRDGAADRRERLRGRPRSGRATRPAITAAQARAARSISGPLVRDSAAMAAAAADGDPPRLRTPGRAGAHGAWLLAAALMLLVIDLAVSLGLRGYLAPRRAHGLPRSSSSCCCRSTAAPRRADSAGPGWLRARRHLGRPSSPMCAPATRSSTGSAKRDCSASASSLNRRTAAEELVASRRRPRSRRPRLLSRCSTGRSIRHQPALSRQAVAQAQRLHEERRHDPVRHPRPGAPADRALQRLRRPGARPRHPAAGAGAARTTC